MSEKLHDMPPAKRLAVAKKEELKEQPKDLHIQCKLTIACGDKVIAEKEIDALLNGVLDEHQLPTAERRVKQALESFVTVPANLDLSNFVRELLETHKLLNEESRMFGPSNNLSIPLGDESAIPMLSDAAPPMGLPEPE
jgi:hypothetical protein